MLRLPDASIHSLPPTLVTFGKLRSLTGHDLRSTSGDDKWGQQDNGFYVSIGTNLEFLPKEADSGEGLGLLLPHLREAEHGGGPNLPIGFFFCSNCNLCVFFNYLSLHKLQWQIGKGCMSHKTVYTPNWTLNSVLYRNLYTYVLVIMNCFLHINIFLPSPLSSF